MRLNCDTFQLRAGTKPVPEGRASGRLPHDCPQMFHVKHSGKKGDRMDVTAITQIVSTLGFPIAMCIYLLYRDGKRDMAHKEEMAKMTEAINNNTIALTQLAERMEKHDTE
jgi:hypothetical protein